MDIFGGNESVRSYWEQGINHSALRLTNGTNSSGNHWPKAVMFPLEFRIIGTILHSLIFIAGVLGNVLICVAVRRTRALQTPTYCYLVSLAVADLLLLCSAVPEAILSYHLFSKQWILGHVTCSFMVFSTFLAINAGSISILAFTVERYIAICRPMLAQTLCTVSRARRIIAMLWILLTLYCTPWLALSVTRPLLLSDVAGLEKCDYRLARDSYLALFVVDVTLFYLLPLLVAVVLYSKMGLILYRSIKRIERNVQTGASGRAQSALPLFGNETYSFEQRFGSCSSSTSSSVYKEKVENTIKSRWKVVKMLLVVVICFAVLWLPYRGLLVYNSFGRRPWLNKWYVLFAKTLVYANSAVNPLLYTLLSRKFRRALYDILCVQNERRKSKKVIQDSISKASLMASPFVLPIAFRRMIFIRQQRLATPEANNRKRILTAALPSDSSCCKPGSSSLKANNVV